MFGSQSTGKSEVAQYTHYELATDMIWNAGTLLNRLFGTNFDVMDETQRQQTTKGAYALSIVWALLITVLLARNLDVQSERHERHGHGRGGHGWQRARRRPGLSSSVSPGSSLTGTPCFQDFERKSALFSLASSEVLIVNLWEHQVGLYQGANMGLLKTVFEVNLGLFGKKTADGCVHSQNSLLTLA